MPRTLVEERLQSTLSEAMIPLMLVEKRLQLRLLTLAKDRRKQSQACEVIMLLKLAEETLLPKLSVAMMRLTLAEEKLQPKLFVAMM